MACLDTLLPDQRRTIQGRLLIGTPTREQVHHRVIALVACVLEQVVEGVAGVTPPHGQRDRVGRRVCRGVLDRELVVDGVDVAQREAFNQPQRPAGPSVCRLDDVGGLQVAAVQPVVEMDRLDDQGVALPVTA